MSSSRKGKPNGLWGVLREDFTQFIALSRLVVELTFSRFFFNVIIVLVPLLGLLVLWVVKILNGNMVIPMANSVLRDLPGGEVQFIEPKPFSLFNVIKFLSTARSRDKEEVGLNDLRVLYQIGMEDFPRNELLSSSVLFDDFLGNLTSLTSIFGGKTPLKRVNVENIDRLIFDNLHEEEFNDKKNDIIGAIYIDEVSPGSFRYGIQNEARMVRFSPSEVPTQIRKVMNNHTDQSRFCSVVGMLTESFNCDHAISHILQSLLDSIFIQISTGRIVVSSATQMPFLSAPEIPNAKHEILGGSMLVMLVLVSMVYFVNHLVSSKQNNVLCFVMGLKKRIYYFVTWTFFLIYEVGFFALFYFFGRFVFGFRLFTALSFGLWVVLFACTAFSAISTSFLISGVFKSSFNATFFTFALIVTFSQSLCNIIESTSYEKISVPIVLASKILDFVLFPFNICDVFTQVKRTPLYHRSGLDVTFLVNDRKSLVAVIGSFVLSLLYFGLYLLIEQYQHNNGFLTRRNSSVQQRSLINEEDEKDSAIEIKEYKKSYGKKAAVKGISFRVKRGEIFGLLGENGSGKTTTVKSIIGIHGITSGEIFVCGRSVSAEVSKVRRLVGVCPQHSIVWDALSVNSHLFFYAGVRGIALRDQKSCVEKVVKSTGLQNLKKRVAKLSLSERRKLSIAISLLGDPEVVVMDEPTVDLSQREKLEIWKIVRGIVENDKKAVLITTHFMDECEILCDRIGVLAGGKLMALGTPIELKKKYNQGKVVVRVKMKKGKDESVELFRNNGKVTKELGRVVEWEVDEECSVSELVEELCECEGVSEWKIGLGSLEDVCVKISKNEEQQEEEAETISESKSKEEIVVVQESNAILILLTQCFVLVKKHFILSFRLWIGIVVQIIFSILMVLTVVASQKFGGRTDTPIVFREFEQVSPIVRCSSKGTFLPCYDLIYSTNGNSFGDQVISELNTNGVVQSTLRFSNESEMLHFIRDNPNRTALALSFDSKEGVQASFAGHYVKKNFTSYNIYYNSTGENSFFGDVEVQSKSLQLAIANAILFLDTGRDNVISVQRKNFPRVPFSSTCYEYDGYHQSGAVVYNGAGFFTIIFVFYLVVMEKEKGARKLLRLMGMQKASFFISEVFTFSIFGLFSVLISCITSLILNIPVFTKSNLFIPCLALFLNMFSFYALSKAFVVHIKTMNFFWGFILAAGIGSYYIFFILDTTLIYGIWDSAHWILKYFFLPLLVFPYNISSKKNCQMGKKLIYLSIHLP